MKYVLFVCTQNAGRSQMAQAFFERRAPDDVRAESAGDIRDDRRQHRMRMTNRRAREILKARATTTA